MCVGEVASPATIMPERRADIPTGAAMNAKRSALGSVDMGKDFGADGSKRCSIKIEVTVQRGISR
jgi:hypothetical protein